jgi:hypothetical protein
LIAPADSTEEALIILLDNSGQGIVNKVPGDLLAGSHYSILNLQLLFKTEGESQ